MMIHSTSASPKGNVKTTTKSLLSLHNTPTTKSAATEPPSRLNVATTTSIPNIFTTAGVILATTMMNTMGTTTDIPIQNELENQKQECSQNNCCGEGTKWVNGICVATREGLIKACKDARGPFGWSCEEPSECHA